MSKLYDITIIGSDNLATWLTASALAGLDQRTVLILDRAPDPDLVPFPWLPFDASRHRSMMLEAGLKPRRSPVPRFESDFQIMAGDLNFDIVADPFHWYRALEREFQGITPTFLKITEELDKNARALEKQAMEKGFPYMSEGAGNPVKAIWNKVAGFNVKPSPPFAEWSEGMTVEQVKAIFAAAAATLGAPLPPDISAVNVAMLWRFCRLLHPGGGPDQELREQAAARVAKRGVVIEATPDSLINQGKMLRSVRLRGGVVIDTKVLFSSRQALKNLLDINLENKKRKEPARTFTRATFFYRIEKSAIPESMAPRFVLIPDPSLPLEGKNLMILTRSPRVPKRETLAVTLYSPPPGLREEDLPALMAESLPWLDPDMISIDDTRVPAIAELTAPYLDLSGVEWPNTKYENVFPLPNDILPAWGPAGMPVALRSLRAAAEATLDKYKNRSF